MKGYFQVHQYEKVFKVFKVNRFEFMTYWSLPKRLQLKQQV